MQVEKEIALGVQEQSEALRNEIARRERLRNGMRIISSVTALIIIGFAGWYLLQFYQASEATKQIRTGIAKQHVSTTKRLVQNAEARRLPRYSSALASAIEEARVYLSSVAGAFNQALQHLEEFETLSAAGSFPNSDPISQFLDVPWSPHWQNEDFAESDPKTVNAVFEKLEKEVAALPVESQTPLKQRVQVSRSQLAAWFTKMAQKNLHRLESGMDVFDQETKPALDKEQSIVDFRKVLDVAINNADSWNRAAGISHAAFELPPEVARRLQATEATLAALKSGILTCEAAIAEMDKAKSAEDFNTALEKLGASNLTSIKEISDARTSLAVKTTPNAIISSLLFPHDPSAWGDCTKGGEAMEMHPQKLLSAENAAYDKLLNDSNSDKIFQARIQGNPSRIIYSANEGLSERTTPVGTKVFSGKIYDPQFAPSGVKFTPRTFDSMSYENRERATEASDIRLSPFSTIYSAMFSEPFMLDNGDVVTSVWKLVDRATGARAKSPAYVAFVAQQIEALISTRPHAWAQHFAPSAKTLFKSLRDSLGGERVISGDWMIPEKSQLLEKRLGSIFSKPTSFQSEAAFYRELTTLAKAKGLEYVGYVGSDGKPVLDSLKTRPESLFGLAGSAGANTPARIFEDREGTYYALEAPIPFTPLFQFAGDRGETLQIARKAAGLSSSATPFVPPLFSGLPSSPSP